MTRSDLEELAAKADIALMFFDQGETEKAESKVAEIFHKSKSVAKKCGLTPEETTTVADREAGRERKQLAAICSAVVHDDESSVALKEYAREIKANFDR